MITICNKLKLGRLPGNLSDRDLKGGKFFPDNPSPDFDIDVAIEKAYEEFNYFLDLTGSLKLITFPVSKSSSQLLKKTAK